MVKLLFYYFFIFNVLILFGCVHPGVKHTKEESGLSKSINYNASYQNVWDATISALSYEVIKSSNKNLKTIVTEYKKLNEDELTTSNMSLFLKEIEYCYAINFSEINKYETLVNVSVHLQSRTLGFYSRDERHPDIENHLRNKLFTRISSSIDKILIADKQVVEDVKEESQLEIKSPAVPRKVTTKSFDPQVKKIQSLLSELGYNAGPLDGIMGKMTRNALRNFQRDNHIPETGNIDDSTLHLVGLLEKTEQHGKKEVIPEDYEKEIPEAKEVKTSDSETKEKTIQDEVNEYIGKGLLLETASLLDQPSVMANSLYEIPKGTTINIILKQDNFYKVSFKDAEGYVYAVFIQFMEP
jgi:peptidoglycan hydrolase-like protein with peptidoglycan-binding domain